MGALSYSQAVSLNQLQAVNLRQQNVFADELLAQIRDDAATDAPAEEAAAQVQEETTA